MSTLPDQDAMGQRGGCLLDYKTGDKQKRNAEANIFCGVPQGSLLFRGFRSDGDDCKLSSTVKPKSDCKQLQEDLAAPADPMIKCQMKISINKCQLIQKAGEKITFLHRH